jgi:hypothetical protein
MAGSAPGLRVGDDTPDAATDAEVTLAFVRAATRTQLERALDDATRAATDSWARERERWVSERAELESRAESLAARVTELETHNASLGEQLRDAENAGAMAAAETRKTRAELDDLRDDEESRFQRLRAEVKVWEDACRKYRKRMEHAERALSRLKTRAGAAGFVEATQLDEENGRTRLPDGARRSDPSPSLSPAPSPSPPPRAPPPPLAPVAARKRPRDEIPRRDPKRDHRAGAFPPDTAHEDATRAGAFKSAERDGAIRKRIGATNVRAAEGWRRPRATTSGFANESFDRERYFDAIDARHGKRESPGLWGASPAPRGGEASGGRGGKTSAGGNRERLAFGDGDVALDVEIRRDLESRDVSDRELFAIGKILRPKPTRRNDDARARFPASAAASRAATESESALDRKRNGFEKNLSEKEIKSVEVVRGAFAREKLPAFACEACEKFYAANGRSAPEGKRGEACAHCPGPNRAKDWSRHRARWAPPPAPRGFWNLDLTPAETENG